MDDLETLLQTLNKQLIENAAQIDPAFKKKVEADRRELEEHEKRLEAQRLAQKTKEEPKTEYHKLWEKMKTPTS